MGYGNRPDLFLSQTRAFRVWKPSVWAELVTVQITAGLLSWKNTELRDGVETKEPPGLAVAGVSQPALSAALNADGKHV